MLLLPVEAAVEAAVEEAELPQAVSMPPASISESADWNSLLFFMVFSPLNLFFMCVQGCQAPDIQFCSGESELHAGRQQILAFAVHPDQQQEDHAADALDECAGNTDH